MKSLCVAGGRARSYQHLCFDFPVTNGGLKSDTRLLSLDMCPFSLSYTADAFGCPRLRAARAGSRLRPSAIPPLLL